MATRYSALDADVESLAYTALVTAIFAGSTAGILIRWSNAPVASQVFFRLLFTTAMVAPVAFFRDREDFALISGRDWVLSVVTGAVLAVHFLFYFQSIEWTTIAATTTLSQIHAAVVPFGAYVLLSERITRRMVAGLTVAFGGVVFVSTGGLLATSLLGGVRPLWGNAFAIIAALCFAGYTLAGRSVRQRLSLFPYVTIVYTIATVTTGVYAVGTGAPVFHAFPLREWIIFLALAVGPGLLTHTGLNWALEHVDASVGSAAFLAIPVISTILAVVLLGEIPSLITLGGGAISLCGVYLVVSGTPGE